MAQGLRWQALAGRGKRDGERSERADAVSLRFTAQPFGNRFEIARAQLCDVARGGVAAIGVDRVDRHMQRIDPRRSAALGAPGAERDGGQNEQQQGDAQCSPHAG